MDKDKSIDADLLKRMMMGDFSSTFSNKNQKSKSNSKINKSELDLHFNRLFPSEGHLPAKDKLELQLETLMSELLKAQKKGSKHLYVIVGKGEGVLMKQVKLQLKHLNKHFSVVYDPPYFGNALKVQL